MKNVIILCRYEYWAKKGKRWCEWYVADSTPRTLKESKQKIAEMKASSARTAKLTKLNYEYKTGFLD
jgi:hypothetical protein